MKKRLKQPSALWFPWFFSFWAVQLVGNLSLMDWSSLSERLSAQPIRLIWSCRIAFFGVKTPCQTLGLRSFVVQNEIDRAAVPGGMPAGRLNCGDWRAIMNWRVEIVSPLLHYKCSLLTVICNQWAQAFCQSSKIRQAALLTRNRRSHRGRRAGAGRDAIPGAWAARRSCGDRGGRPRALSSPLSPSLPASPGLGMWHCAGNPAWTGMNETWLLQQDDILGVKETTPTQAGVSK